LYQIYLETILKVIGWSGAVAKILECGEEREAIITITKVINLLA
jgi:hypothetical protein